MRSRPLLVLGAAATVAAGVWVSGGAIAVTDAAAWPRRVGVLPSYWLPLLVSTVLAAALLRARRRVLLPLLFLLVLLLPWLPVAVPAAALLWTGPLVIWIWLVTALAVAIAVRPAPARRGGDGAAATEAGEVSERRWLARAARWIGKPARASWMAIGLAFVLYCAAARIVSNVIPGGDEPHYLVITQSLLKDGDLQIENNHRRGDYRAYFAGDLKPDFLRRGRNGQIYSIHAPGLPAVVLPAFALAGYPGVVVFLAFLSALGTGLVWRAAFRLTGRAGAAWFGWASVALSTPFFFHAFTVYPDATGALLVMTGVTALLAFERDLPAPDRGPAAAGHPWGVTRWILQGAALGLLPWLHTRYAGAAAVLGMSLAWRLLERRSYARLTALFAVPLVSAAGWFGSFYVIYGEFNPAAPYGHYTQSALSNIPNALPALLFDQQFGVIPNAPIYALALAGLWAMFRTRRRLTIEIAVLLVSYLSLVATYHMWWGGWSAPARFTVPVLPMLGLPAAVLWSRRQAAGRAVATSALAASVLVTGTLTLAGSGALIFNTRDGIARWLEWATPVVDVPRALPSFLRDTPGPALLVTAVWLLAFLAAGLGLRVLAGRVQARGGEVRAALALATPAAFALAAMLAASVTWPMAGVAGPTPSSSALAVLRGLDPVARPIGVQFRPPRVLAPANVVPRLQLAGSERRPLSADGPLLVLTDVPAGVYHLSRAAAMAAQGTVEVTIGRGPQPVERWVFDPSSREKDYVLRLPVAVNAVTLTGDAPARRSLPRPSLQPVAILPRAARLTGDRAARAARYGSLIAFSFGPEAHLEEAGIWLEAGVAVPLAVEADPPAGRLSLLVRNGPLANHVTFRVRDRVEELALGPGEERTVVVRLDRQPGGALLVVEAERGFRPADLEPGKADHRDLGAWLRPAPER